jgi:hypothetical protein
MLVMTVAHHALLAIHVLLATHVLLVTHVTLATPVATKINVATVKRDPHGRTGSKHSRTMDLTPGAALILARLPTGSACN